MSGKRSRTPSTPKARAIRKAAREALLDALTGEVVSAINAWRFAEDRDGIDGQARAHANGMIDRGWAKWSLWVDNQDAYADGYGQGRVDATMEAMSEPLNEAATREAELQAEIERLNTVAKFWQSHHAAAYAAGLEAAARRCLNLAHMAQRASRVCDPGDRLEYMHREVAFLDAGQSIRALAEKPQEAPTAPLSRADIPSDLEVRKRRMYVAVLDAVAAGRQTLSTGAAAAIRDLLTEAPTAPCVHASYQHNGTSAQCHRCGEVAPLSRTFAPQWATALEPPTLPEPAGSGPTGQRSGAQVLRDAQAQVPADAVARAILTFTREFRGVYSAEVLSRFIAVGPTHSFVGVLLRQLREGTPSQRLVTFREVQSRPFEFDEDTLSALEAALNPEGA